MDSSSQRSTTAEGTAFCRALGALGQTSALRNPDHLAHHFVTRPEYRIGFLPVLRRLAHRRLERIVPGAFVLHQVRTRIFDDLLLTAVREGARQFVLLGAGGDSRAYRFRDELANVTVFEVDHPETGAWKQACVRRMLGILPPYVRYVPIDFGSQTLAAGLERWGFDASLPTFFLWEGVTMYLRADAIDAVLSIVGRSADGSSVAFDYMYQDAVTHPDRFEAARAHAEFAASKGEPFMFGLSPTPDDLAAFLGARGLTLVKNWNDERLRDVYPGPGFLVPYVGILYARVTRDRR